MAILAVGLFVAFFSIRLRKTEAPAKAPTLLSVGNDFTSLKIADLKGKYVLVNFWDSRNAVSRIATAEYDKWSRDHSSPRFSLVQVNTDPDTSLWQEIVAHDSFDPTTQFHLSSAEAKGAQDFRPVDGHVSYLISPEGKVIARNPSIESLTRLVSDGSLAMK